MKKIIVAFFLTVLLAGCATFGPDPTEPEYAAAVQNLPATKNAKYVVRSLWYPNTLANSPYVNVLALAGHPFIAPPQLGFSRAFLIPLTIVLLTNSR